ncbi:MAG: YciI family protein, partial [Solirubrobacteraceae bacterium]
MKYLTFIVTEGEMPADAIATMNREWPAYAQAMDGRGLWRMGRELGLPEDGIATVRVRDGETLVSDGPF